MKNGNGRLDQPERNAAHDQAAYIGVERRDAIERRGVWRCPTCDGREMRIVGSRAIGVQIRKCAECGNMDPRLPNERRRPWSFTAPRSISYSLGVVALVVLVLGVLIGLAVLS
jgi:hypothetical protein